MATRKKKTEQAAPTVEEPKKYPDPKIRSFRTELDVILTDEEIKQRRAVRRALLQGALHADL